MVSNSQTELFRKTTQQLKKSKSILFGIGVAGLWLFTAYIILFYGGIVLRGTYEQVNERLGHGVVEGDVAGNFMLAVHIFVAAIITFGGPLQFFSSVRNRFPVFHRWLGRIYFTIAFLAAGSGLYMNATRGAHGGWVMGLGNLLNAILIMAFAILAWRTAIQRDFKAHRKWAIRTFVMVSGVWFFRIGYGLWILLTGFTGVGANADLTGPFDRFLAMAHWLIPLVILECYFWAKSHQNPIIKQRTAYFFGALSIFLIVGIGMATMIFWWPALAG